MTIQSNDPLSYNPAWIEEQARQESESLQTKKQQLDKVVEQDKITMYKALTMDESHGIIRDYINRKREENYSKLLGRSDLDKNETMESVRLVMVAYQDLLDFYNTLETEGAAAIKKLKKEVKKHEKSKKAAAKVKKSKKKKR